jgi:xanthine dehydrogenase YagS FAD-binding subunit
LAATSCNVRDVNISATPVGLRVTNAIPARGAPLSQASTESTQFWVRATNVSALAALGAQVEVTGPRGKRTIAFDTLHLASDDSNAPAVETSLAPGELITAFLIVGEPWMRRSVYLKIRDRQSYEFALTSAAVALDVENGIVRDSRIGLGGVAYKPWRSHEGENALKGVRLDEATATNAAQAAFAGARARGENQFKIELGRRTLARAILAAGQLEI